MENIKLLLLLVVATLVSVAHSASQKRGDGCWSIDSIPKSWHGGYKGAFKISDKARNGWKGTISFSKGVDKLETWTAKNDGQNGNSFSLSNVDWNGNIGQGQQLTIEFVVHFKSGDVDKDPCFKFEGEGGNTVVTPAKVGPVVTSKPVVGGPGHKDDGGDGRATIDAKYPYTDLLGKSLWFYEIQRSGKLPANKRIPFRGDSGTDDGRSVGMDLTGGWHDAGDHVKFGFPMAGSTTMLLYGLIFFKDGYTKANQYNEALNQFDWPLRYFIKCAAKDGRFYGQVGNGHQDHAWWGRPEEMAGNRPAYYVGGGKQGGADLLGETAAALAAGSVAFAHDAAYKQQLLNTAVKVYNLGKTLPGVYTPGPIPDAKAFYGSDEWKDDMAHGAAWLAYAGAGDNYKAEAKSYLNAVPGVPWALDWSDKRSITHWLMYKMTKEASHKQYIENFLKEWLPGGSVRRTPKGLCWRQEWGANRYAANAAFLALLSAREGIRSQDYVNFAKSQINYMLGDGGRSFVVGFGNNSPKRAHHKAASCPNSGPCGWNNYNSQAPNPNGPDGALCGGPDANDNFNDDRSKYQYTEVATDYNGGYTGALAGLIHFTK